LAIALKKSRRLQSGLKFIETSAGFILLQFSFVGNGQFPAAFGPAAGQHFTAIGCLHTLPETMYRFAAFTMRLKCTYHFFLRMRAGRTAHFS